MLAYCSSTTEGTPTVEVSMQGGALAQVTSAACKFDADLFSTQTFECNDETFTNECNSQECGGLTGCGACSDDQCCNGYACVGPVDADDPSVDGLVNCTGQPELCGQSDRVCGNMGQDCLDPAPPGVDFPSGDACLPGCELGAYWCENIIDDPMTMESHNECSPARSLGTPCVVPWECASLNCYYVDPDNPFEGRRCLPEARIYDHCGPIDAVCEDGATCEGSSCEPRRGELVTCARSDQCRQAVCVTYEGGNFCDGPSACYWAWDEKVPG
jgi:hypothetical protein